MSCVRVIDNPSSFRTNVYQRIKTLFQDHFEEEVAEVKAKNIEIGIYNSSIQEANVLKVIKKWDNPKFITLYINKFRSIWFNINNVSYIQNNSLRTKLYNNEIKSKDIAAMTHQEMNPEIWKESIDAKIKRDKNKYEVDMRSATDEFQCRRCRERKCSYYQLQTRSADEPMTTFVTCLNCGNNWKC
jgi:transcription elongation factor S-II